MDNPFTAIELCAGYGGICLGLKRVIPNLRVVAYSEIESFACANLVAKIEKGRLDAAPIWTDLKTFPAKEFYGKVDIITGGYPCQPFSHAGQRQGEDDPRHLWPYIRSIVGSARPLYVFLENVEGHITLGLDTVISDLGELGYRTTWGIFSASEIGAPHERKRVFILGRLADATSPEPNGLSGIQRQKDRSIRNASGEGKLAHPGRERRRGRDNGEPRGSGRPLQTEGSSELADAGYLPGCAQQKQQQKECPEKFCRGAELADSNEAGRGEQCGAVTVRQELRPVECSRYPSRPGEPQYEWEPPRVADNCNRRDDGRGNGVGRRERQPEKAGETVTGCGGEGDGLRQTQPALGGNPDEYPDWMVRSTSRVDELRLLGNGVVPATAAKAWSVLHERIMQ